MIWLLAAIFMFVVTVAFFLRQYAFSLFIALVAVYELPFQFFIEFQDLIGETSGGGAWHFIEANIFFGNLSIENIELIRYVLLAFVVISSTTYFILISSNVHFKCRFLQFPIVTMQRNLFFQYAPLLLALIILGMVSFMTEAGQSRLAVYSGSSTEEVGFGTTALYYGQSLLVCVALLFVYAFWELPRKNRLTVIAIIFLCSFPLVTQIFLAGRRQFFVPSFLLIILFLAYSPHLKHRRLWLLGIPVVAGIVGLLQFALRQVVMSGGELNVHVVAGSTDYSLLPMLAEFVAVAATTFNAITTISIADMTYGLHIPLSALDSIPGIRVGNLLRETFGIALWAEYDSVAPYGSFSMLADAWLSINWIGILVFSVSSGVFLYLVHSVLSTVFSRGRFVLSFLQVYLLGLVASWLSMYRKGIAECVGFLLSYSILFLVFVVIPWIMLRHVITKTSKAQKIR